MRRNGRDAPIAAICTRGIERAGSTRAAISRPQDIGRPCHHEAVCGRRRYANSTIWGIGPDSGYRRPSLDRRRRAGRTLRNAEAARFALDSLLEGGGFEPSVPPPRRPHF